MADPEAQFSPPDDDPLRRVIPAVDDVEARRARAAIEGRLFAGRPSRIKVGRYAVEGRIGAGGMGVVYRAHDPELARHVAVKLMNTQAVTDEQARLARARLVREARAMARLAHPNVIHVYDVGTVEDGVFIAMELVEGASLDTWLAASKRPWLDVLRHFVAAGRGLAAAHEAGVVHRDFKPENVLVGTDERVRVCDFGLAGAPSSDTTIPEHDPADGDGGEIDASDVGASLTRTGTLLGTPKYMAPEQELGAEVTAQSDQFSFCVALHEALYGRPPFEGSTVAAYRKNVQEGRLLPPPLDSPIPAWIHDVVVRGLKVDPTDRHASMVALLDRLDEALRDPKLALAKQRQAQWRFIGAALAVSVIVAAVITTRAGGDQDPTADVVPVPPTAVSAAAPGVDRPPAAEVPPEPAPDRTPPEAVDPGPAAPAALPGGGSGGDGAVGSGNDAPTTPRADDLAPTADKPRRGRVKPARTCYFLQDKFTPLGDTKTRKNTLRTKNGCYVCRDARTTDNLSPPREEISCRDHLICAEETPDHCGE